ncbi:FtsX-like permease family protein [Agromyces larvae]|uniref:ABC transporter permease n=1 Tax=Agromyces larvae TaxID=2929802 RepID=A0ABY4BWJ2_9MICO|nr:ABC transporter permease [Agromyces larvae]UOE43602.1 ABC transporter permease [Agromyces larvae]
MWSFARSAVRAYRSGFVGSFLIVVSAAALLAANGVLMETGLRGDAPMLTTVAASFAGTAILVVVLVVASTFAAALRQRHAQFALLRAVGATTAQVRSMVTAEVVIVFALAAPLGAVPGLFAAELLTPVLVSGGIVPAGLALTITPLPVIGALILLLPTALLASRLAARKVTKVSPTAAVQGAAAESAHLSGARRATAVALLVSGILVAGTPFIVPGTMGSAAGATSAFLLISAAALAGPAIVGAVASRAAHATRSSSNAAVRLALVNSRGFSRRLTAAIIPLALFLALGTVQTGVNAGVVEAAGVQLRAGLGSDVIITSPDGVTAEQTAAVASTPGIAAVVRSSTVAAEVKTDGDEDPGGSVWEQTGVHAVSGSTAGLIDAEVTAGSLDALTRAATIAVSSESLFGTGKGVGDTVDLRFDRSTELSATIVAVYDRGLGFGEYLIDESSLPEQSRPAVADLLLAQGSADLSSLGLQTASVDEYVDGMVAGAASQQQLSAILLFVLVFFVAIAAANTLVMLTGARRAEFALLRRIGATRRQLTRMIAIESGFVMVTAVVIGTLSVVPALVGVAYGMLGGFSPTFDWPVYGVLAAAVVLIAGVAMVGSARTGSRRAAGV